jgi:predicted O-methyltransferase YrrM
MWQTMHRPHPSGVRRRTTWRSEAAIEALENPRASHDERQTNGDDGFACRNVLGGIQSRLQRRQSHQRTKEGIVIIRGWPHHIEKIKELLRVHRPKRCVEVGTFCGASAIPIAQTIDEWGGRLTCVDVWGEPQAFLECMDNMEKTGIAYKVRFIRAASEEVARDYGELVDFIYIDANHSLESVTADLNAWWPHLGYKGLICGDDYDDPESPGVAVAWTNFARQHNLSLELYATPNTRPPGMKLAYIVKT